MDWLIERMEQWKSDPAIVSNDLKFSYEDVLQSVEKWSAELEAQGVRPGTVVGLEGDYSLQNCALLLALIKCKTIIVPLTKAVEVHKEEFLETAEVQLAFTLDKGDSCSVEKRSVVVQNPLLLQLREVGEPGLVLFSSGSTGKNKAALHIFTTLLEKFKVPRHRMRTLNFLLFDHIGGINTLFYTLSNGVPW